MRRNMKKYRYSLTTNTLWTSFDYGEVEADTREEAREKAFTELKHNLSKVNNALTNCDSTRGFTIDMDFSQIEIEDYENK